MVAYVREKGLCTKCGVPSARDFTELGLVPKKTPKGREGPSIRVVSRPVEHPRDAPLATCKDVVRVFSQFQCESEGSANALL
jgi:hypothetical protein